MRFVPAAKHVPLLTTTGVFLALYTIASLAYDGFATWYQFTNLFRDNATLGLAAIGMTFVILSGGIDLSVGAAVALSSMLVAQLVVAGNVQPLFAIPIVLAVGTALGEHINAENTDRLTGENDRRGRPIVRWNEWVAPNNSAFLNAYGFGLQPRPRRGR